MADLIQMNGRTAKIEFDKVRKLKPTHGAVSNALMLASKDYGRPLSVSDLIGDVFVGQRYLLLALLSPALAPNENMTLNKVSDLIDAFRDKGGKIGDLKEAITLLLAEYLGIETTKTDDEDDDPNETAPAATGAGD
jgi:hypothetical protein